MKKKLEKKIAYYLNKIIDYKEYSKMADWMGKDEDLFNNWVSEMGHDNT